MMDVLPIPDRDDYRTAASGFEERGYTVHGLCPECQWGLIVENQERGWRPVCSAYGQCELAPG